MAGVIVCCALWGMPAPAMAQDQGAAPSQAEQERAARHYQRGTGYFKEGEYQLALAEYERAYQLSRAPLLLFNIGLTYRAQGKREQALASFRRFLSERASIQTNGQTGGQTGGRARDEVGDEARGYIRELEQALARERDSADPGQTPGNAQTNGQTNGQTTAGAGTSASSASGADPERALDTRATPSRPGRNQRLTGLALAIGGSAALGTGVYFGLRARSLSTELSEHQGPWTDAELARIDDGEAAQRNFVILGAAGTALVVAGGVTYWLATRRHAETSANTNTNTSANTDASTTRTIGPATRPVTLTVVPALSPDAAGILVTGSFF